MNFRVFGKDPSKVKEDSNALGIKYKAPSGGSEEDKIFVQADDYESQFIIAERYICGGSDIPIDIDKGLFWIRSASQGGYMPATFCLSKLYRDGVLVEQDMGRSVELLMEVANYGDAKAESNLALCYATGEGVPQDYVKAVEWYKKAANKGNADAQINLGICYCNGYGVPQNQDKAIEWWTKAANQGNEYAIKELGLY